ANWVGLGVWRVGGGVGKGWVGFVPNSDKVFFANSGTEATETAIKFARRATGRPGIVYCEHAFHGLTNGSLSLNGDEIFRNGFEPLLPPCLVAPLNSFASLVRARPAPRTAPFF